MSERDMSRWENYNALRNGRHVRPLLIDALAHTGPGEGRVAVDIGRGAGIETRWLLDAGWTVYALDADAQPLGVLTSATTAATRSRLYAWEVDLNALPMLPSADFIYSGYALPFTEPAHFHQMWSRVRQALAPSAILAVNLFGDYDSWAGTGQGTFMTETQTRALLQGLEVLRFHVQDEDGMAVSGPKHSHVFDIIALRPAT
jgi:trans-aconitate methyltransferase